MLYADPETGVPISTHSMLKCFRRCPKQAEYKYQLRLKPKRVGKPLKRGVWVHRLVEVHNLGGDWRQEHAKLSADFNRLFDEEKDFYGDLPREIYQIMVSYFWHYKNVEWKVIDAEFVLECEFPNGQKFRCKIDALVETQFGLYIVDTKSHASLPNLNYRILDAQSADYLWCAHENDLDVKGHIWDYIRWKPPTKPLLLKNGTLSRRAIDTDYVTYGNAIKEYGLDPREPYIQAKLKYLKGLQYKPGEPQVSSFFRRDVLEKTPALVKRVAQEAYHTHTRMHNYPWDRPQLTERVIERSCTFMCSYNELCALELWGGNPKPLLKNYTVEDPMAYYDDEKDVVEERN